MSHFIWKTTNKDIMEQTLQQKLEQLGNIFSLMVENYNEFDQVWKNIELGKEAFRMMMELPDVVEGEFETPQEKASILSNMLDNMEETASARFCIKVRKEIASLDPENRDNMEMLGQLEDFIDARLPMLEYCRKYEKLIKFDPVERTEEWEEVIYEVEKECAEILKDEPKGMGFCFAYWSTKAAVLKKHGIAWKSPPLMNPGIHFD